MERSAFIWLLELGEEIGLQGIEPAEAERRAKAAGLFANPEADRSSEEKRAFFNLFHECFERTQRTEETAYVLKSEYFFRLIEFRELQESRLAASSARRWAAGALAVSIIAMLLSGGIGYLQLTRPLEVRGEVALTDRDLERIGACCTAAAPAMTR